MQTLIGTINNIERLDTSKMGNPRYTFLLELEGGTDTHCGELVRLQTTPNAALAYGIDRFENKKVTIEAKVVRGKLCAITCKEV
jgi:hypothetical protein